MHHISCIDTYMCICPQMVHVMETHNFPSIGVGHIQCHEIVTDHLLEGRLTLRCPQHWGSFLLLYLLVSANGQTTLLQTSKFWA